MSNLGLAPDSHIELHPLFRRPDEDSPDSYIVGRTATSVYVTPPAIGLEAVELLDQGHSLQEAEERLAICHGVTVDMASLVGDLASCGFVRTVDGQPLTTGYRPRTLTFAGLRREQVAWLFSRPALLVWGLITLLTAYLLLTPAHRPHNSDFFFHSFYTINTLAMFGIGWVLVLAHELWHLVAARAQGLGASIRISHRLYWLVAETDISDVYIVPRKRRYPIYLAGMLGDILAIFGFLLLQIALFARTDLYYVLATFLRCNNLLGDTQSYLRHLAAGFIPRIKAPDLSAIPSRELRIVRLYAFVYVAGLGFAGWFLLVVILPVMGQMLGGTLEALLRGYQTDPAAFLDGLVFIGLTGFNLILLGFTSVRNRLRERREMALVKIDGEKRDPD
jgi:putative peptide zinc metalloprotease protein